MSHKLPDFDLEYVLMDLYLSFQAGVAFCLNGLPLLSRLEILYGQIVDKMFDLKILSFQ